MELLRRLAWIAGIVIVITWVVRDPASAGQFTRSLGHLASAGADALNTLAANL
jgi:hypothetical protein